MKTISTRVITVMLLILLNINLNAQCISPDLKFANPVLVSGTALSEGAIYKFPNITPGIDCFIKLVKLNGGATLISMETPGQGYGDACQPIIKGPGAPTGNKSWIDWDISFKTRAGANYAFSCLDISAIDVDGDNVSIGEFVESDGQVNYSIPSPTLLTLTDMGSGRLEAQATITNRVSIKTMAMDVRIGFLYNGKDNIQLKLGSKVWGAPGTGATQRLNCIYFKRIAFLNYEVLPVKYISFSAAAFAKKVELNWLTDNEVNVNYFELERSFDGSHFSAIGMIMDGFDYGSNKNYTMSDHDKVLAGREIAYYRLKQVNMDGTFNYSSVVMVKLQANKGITMQVTPNPFTDNLSVHFKAVASGTGLINMQNVTGEVVAVKNIIFDKGDNIIQIGNLSGLSKGVFAVKVIINGIVADNQKIIKNL